MIIKLLDLSIIAFCCKLFLNVQVWGTIIHGKCSIFYLSLFCGEALRILIKAMRRNTMAEVNAYALPKCQLEPPTWFLLFARVSTSLLCRCTNDLHGHTRLMIKPPPFAFPLGAHRRHCLHPHTCRFLWFTFWRIKSLFFFIFFVLSKHFVLHSGNLFWYLNEAFSL